MARLEGEGSVEKKTDMGVGLLVSCSPLEAKYLTRYMLNRLRLGVGDPTIMNGLAIAVKGDRTFREQIEKAYNLCSDLGRVARLVKEGVDPSSIHMEPFMPIRPALAERLNSAEAIINKIGPCFADAKYDGFRLQVHKFGQRVEIYSRKQERLTHMFPELIKEIMNLPGDWIFEGEAVGIREGKFLSFQETIRRRRKHNVEEAAQKFPLNLFVFDVLYHDGDLIMEKPFKERRKYVEKYFNGTRIHHSWGIHVDNASQLQAFFDECIHKNLEGIIAKDLSQPYIAGARKFAWIKLKKSYGGLADTIDVVIVGYYRGKGERAGLLGGVLTAVYNPEYDRFETIAKVGSGLTEEEMEDLKNRLESIRVPSKPPQVFSHLEPDVWVEPQIVVTVMADEITDSPLHTCAWDGKRGLALRFPRIQQIREDKSPYEATTTHEVIEMKHISSHT